VITEGMGIHMRYRIEIFTFVFSILALFLGTGIAGDKIPVFVSIVPQKHFVQQIGKDLIDVQAMVHPGASPATYEPRPRQMADLTEAKIYFAIGVPFESAWLGKIAAANPRMRVVHTDSGIKKLAMAAHHHDAEVDGHHEEEGRHGSGGLEDSESANHGSASSGLDPHIWLSPPLVKMQARSVKDALQDADPAHRGEYEANFNAFATQIDQLDAELSRMFAGRKGLQFMVFHPAWGYFAHTYGLKQMPIEIEGKNPKPAQLRSIIQHARGKGIRVIFVQPQFSAKSAKLVAREIGGQVAFTNPLAENWTANMRKVADQFRAALK